MIKTISSSQTPRHITPLLFGEGLGERLPEIDFQFNFYDDQRSTR